MKTTLLMLFIMMIPGSLFSQGKKHQESRVTISTDLASLIGSAMIQYQYQIPVKIAESLTEKLELSQSLSLCDFGDYGALSPETLVLVEIGLIYNSNQNFNSGWRLEIEPGLAVGAIDKKCAFRFPQKPGINGSWERPW